MKTYSFSIACTPRDGDRDSDALVDALHEAGCDDALVIERAGAFVLEFDREAPSFGRAVVSALRDILSAGFRPLRIEPDPLVSAADIADRTGLTRQAVTNYVRGQRGQGFPVPVMRIDTASPLWRWSEVTRWLLTTRRAALDPAALFQARSLERTNALLPVIATKSAGERRHVH